MAHASSTDGLKFTPWAGDDVPPPSPLASNSVSPRRHSSELDERKPQGAHMAPLTTLYDLAVDDPDFCKISFGGGIDEQDLTLGDTIQSSRGKEEKTTLVDFLRNHPPPPDNFMSIPYGHGHGHGAEKERGKWSKIKRVGKKRSKSMPRGAPRQMQLPDSAVSGVTTGGHRHIAISIPREAMPFGDANKSQYPIYPRDTEPKETPVRTYTSDNGVVTVLRPTSGNTPSSSLARGPSTSSGPLLPSSSDKQPYGQPYGQLNRNHQKCGSQSEGGSINKGRRQDYIRMLADCTHTPHAAHTRTAESGIPNDHGRDLGRPHHPREFQRSVYPARGSSMAASRRYHQPASIDGLISLYGGMGQIPFEYNQRPLPQPPRTKSQTSTDAGAKELKINSSFPSPVSEKSHEGAGVRRRTSKIHQVISDHPVSTHGQENSPPSTPESIQSRRAKVRDKKRRDMEALRSAKVAGQREKRNGPQMAQQSTNDSDVQSGTEHEHEHLRRPRQNTLCPIMVVVDVEPSPESPVKARSFRRPRSAPATAPETPRAQGSWASLPSLDNVSHPTPPTSVNGSPPQKQPSMGKGLGDWDPNTEEDGKKREAAAAAAAAATQSRAQHHAGGGMSHQRNKESQANRQILRLYDTYRENRIRDVERRVRRLERNGDVWLRALVPVLDDMNRTIKAVVSSETRNMGEWTSDDEVAGAAERKGHNAERRRGRTSLPREDNSEWSESVSRSDEISGLGSMEPLMKELAREARRREKQVAARRLDEGFFGVV